MLLETLHLVTGTLEKAKGINEAKQQVSVYLAHSFKNLPIWNSKRSKAAAYFKRVSVAVFLSGEVSPIFNFI